jgi:single-strand DNA-binding protein
MSSVNKAILLGNVGREPEIKTMRGGDDLANLSVATSESWTDKRSGERVEKTEWNRVVVFNPHLVELIKKAVKKGTRVYLEGQVQTRKWTGQDGVERFSTEAVIPRFGDHKFIILGGGVERGGQDWPQRREGQQQRSQQDLDDEIPF